LGDGRRFLRARYLVDLGQHLSRVPLRREALTAQGAAPGTARPFFILSRDQLCHLNCCSLRAELCDRTMLTRAGPLNFIASSRAFLMSFGSLTKAPKPPKASITL